MGLTANARFARLSPYRQMGGRISIGCLRSIGFSRCHEAKTHCASAATLHIREHRASAIKSARNNIPAGASHVAILRGRSPCGRRAKRLARGRTVTCQIG